MYPVKSNQESTSSRNTDFSGLQTGAHKAASPTELSVKFDQLQRLECLAGLGMLSANLAHEIKNALVPVKTLIDLLLEQNPQTELATVVHRELDRIDLLVAQMLRVSKPVAPCFRPVSIAKVIADSLRLFEHQAKIRSISIEKSFSAQVDMVEGDANQLKQVFTNLFFNAFDAMAEQGTLTVRTETAGQPDRRLKISVADNGVGIDPALAKRLFQPFISTKPEGTGLGLAITREIVNRHQGTISVQSEPGKGTCFTIILPLQA